MSICRVRLRNTFNALKGGSSTRIQCCLAYINIRVIIILLVHILGYFWIGEGAAEGRWCSGIQCCLSYINIHVVLRLVCWPHFLLSWIYTVPQKKVPTFKLSVTLSYLNRLSKFLQCWKAYEICHKTHMTLPPHLRYVATLCWKIKNSNFLQIFSRCVRKCKQIAYLLPLTLLFIHKFWYFHCFK